MHEACYHNGREASQVGGGAIHYFDASGEEEKDSWGTEDEGNGLEKRICGCEGN